MSDDQKANQVLGAFGPLKTLGEFMNRSLTRDIPNYDAITLRLVENPGLVRLLHAAIGMAGEAGEVADLVKKQMMYGIPLDRQKLLLEAGDILWYMAILLDELKSDFGQVMWMNDAKLSKRYPAGFNEEAAKARKDVK